MTGGAAAAVEDSTAAHPGPIPLRPLGVGELLDGAVRLVRATPAAAFAIGFPFALARTIVTLLVAEGTLTGTGGRWWQFLAAVFASAAFGTLRTGVLAPLFTATIVGRPITAAGSLSRAARTALPLVVVAVVVAFAQTGGLVALAVGGVWLWGVWAVAAPALVVEQLGPWRALGRSFALVRSAFWRTWGQRALGWLVTYVLSLLIVVPFGVLAVVATGNDPLDPSGAVQAGVDHAQVYVLLVSLGGLVAAAVTGPIGSAIDTLLYADLRMRREGMDLIMGLPPAPPAPNLPAPEPLTAW